VKLIFKHRPVTWRACSVLVIHALEGNAKLRHGGHDLWGPHGEVLPEAKQVEMRRYLKNHQNQDGGYGLHIEAGPAGCSSPRHPPHLESSSLEIKHTL